MFLGLGEQKEEQKLSLQALIRGWLLCFVPWNTGSGCSFPHSLISL